MMKTKSVVASLSGGIDSTTVLAMLLDMGCTVTGVSFTYGSKHNQYENQAARSIADYYDIELLEIDMQAAFKPFESTLLATDPAKIPEGHYSDESMACTVVPCRNMIFLSVLAGIAESRKYDAIAIGVHQGDHAIYPDCRIDFISLMHQAVIEATEGRVQLSTPLLHNDKADIVRQGLFLHAPYVDTRTCYTNQQKACGRCGSCVERLDAFDQNGMVDPIEYADREFFRTVTKNG